MMQEILKALGIILVMWALWLQAWGLAMFVLLGVDRLFPTVWPVKHKNNWNLALTISIIALTLSGHLLVIAVFYFVLILINTKFLPPLPCWCGIVMFLYAILCFVCAWYYVGKADRNKAAGKNKKE